MVTIFPQGSATPTEGVLQPTAFPSPQDTATVQQPTQSPTDRPELSSPTQIPTDSPDASAPTSQPGGTTTGLPAYLDDRSTADGVIRSLFNAINRKEYLRAYSYWDSSSNTSYQQFSAGYQDTVSVQVTTSAAGEDAGAGQLYFTIPVVLQAINTSNKVQVYSGCYTLHLSQPANQQMPPFQGLTIISGKLQAATSGSDQSALLAAGCTGATVATQAPTSNPEDISSGNYLDNRSDPIEVLRSLFNAINRREYLRAYSYWQGNSTLPSFQNFEQGYQDTASVSANFGTPVNGNGAGQIYYSVPVVLKAQLTNQSLKLLPVATFCIWRSPSCKILLPSSRWAFNLPASSRWLTIQISIAYWHPLVHKPRRGKAFLPTKNDHCKTGDLLGHLFYIKARYNAQPGLQQQRLAQAWAGPKAYCSMGGNPRLVAAIPNLPCDPNRPLGLVHPNHHHTNHDAYPNDAISYDLPPIPDKRNPVFEN